MKRLSLLVLVGILAVGLLSVGAFAAEEDSGSTHVEWYYQGCWVSIDVHSPVDLGDFTTVGEDRSDIDNEVTCNGNCPYDLDVKTTGYTSPIGNDIYDDFLIWVSDESGLGNGSTIMTTSAGETFDFVNQELDVGSSTTSAPDVGSNTWGIGYQYTTDMNDTQGEYQVDLEYIVSTV